MKPILTIGLLLISLPSILAPEETDRPNILLIVADDVGFSDLGCYGGEIDTPNLDRLASEGIRFSEFHVNPMCVVTRTSLMTGHVHSQSDNYRRSLPIARLMKKAGYATSISGKWHQPARRGLLSRRHQTNHVRRFSQAEAKHNLLRAC